MCSQRLCNIAYAAALLTHSLYGLPVLVVQTLILSFCHVLCSFPSSFAFYGKKISVSEFLRSARSSFLLFPIKKENRQRLYNLLSIFILKLISKNVNIKIDIFSCFYRFAILHNTQPVLLYIFTFSERSSKAATAASLSRSLYPLLCKLLYLFLE